MPKRFTDEEKEQISQRLLYAGVDMFNQFGLKHATVDQLAKRAGISKGAFYQFFESKEKLYDACLLSIQGWIDDDIYAIVQANRRHPERIMKLVLRYTLEISKRFPLIAAVRHEQAEMLIDHRSSGSHLWHQAEAPRVRGGSLIGWMSEIGCTCDFTAETVEQLLQCLMQMDMNGRCAEGGERLLIDILDIGFASYVRVS